VKEEMTTSTTSVARTDLELSEFSNEPATKAKDDTVRTLEDDEFEWVAETWSRRLCGDICVDPSAAGCRRQRTCTFMIMWYLVGAFAGLLDQEQHACRWGKG
jgi:hypothetical protein